MKAVVQVSPNITVELNGDKQKDLFKAICSAHEVFGEKACGLCQSAQIVPVWRTVTIQKGKKMETYEYPEWRCQKCGAKLSLGTINDDTGTLYPVRKLVDGKRPPNKEEKEQNKGEYGKHNGWYKYSSKDGDE